MNLISGPVKGALGVLSRADESLDPSLATRAVARVVQRLNRYRSSAIRSGVGAVPASAAWLTRLELHAHTPANTVITATAWTLTPPYSVAQDRRLGRTKHSLLRQQGMGEGVDEPCFVAAGPPLSVMDEQAEDLWSAQRVEPVGGGGRPSSLDGAELDEPFNDESGTSGSLLAGLPVQFGELIVPASGMAEFQLEQCRPLVDHAVVAGLEADQLLRIVLLHGPAKPWPLRHGDGLVVTGQRTVAGELEQLRLPTGDRGEDGRASNSGARGDGGHRGRPVALLDEQRPGRLHHGRPGTPGGGLALREPAWLHFSPDGVLSILTLLLHDQTMSLTIETAAFLARTHLRAMATGNADLARQCIAPEHVNTMALEEPPACAEPGLAGFMATSAWLRIAFQDLTFDVIDLVTEADLTVAHVHMSGRQTGPFVVYPVDAKPVAFPPTSRPFKVRQCHLFTTLDGRHVKHVAVRDDLAMMTQLGHLPPSPRSALRLAGWHLGGSARRAVRQATASAAAAASQLQAGSTQEQS